VSGQGPRKGAKGSKGVAANKLEGQILKCDQLFCCFVFFLRGAIFLGQEPRFYNKIIKVLVFPWGFFLFTASADLFI
jgi:hypothetical protein